MEDKEKRYLNQFVTSELFDLTLYQELLRIEKENSLKTILSELVEIEKKHFEFWQGVTGVSQPKLSVFLKTKLNLFLIFRKIFGPVATVLILEMIEIYGIKKYFLVWQKYKETPLGEKIKEILKDEFEHEDKAITERIQRKISVDKIRSAIFGFNDGLIEIFGALGGFLAAFQNYFLVGFAGFIVGLAGAISMGASAFLSTKSEREIEEIEKRKKEILEQINFKETKESPNFKREDALYLSFYVGIFYFLGALLPVSPFLLGAKSVIFPALIGLFLVLILSFFTAFFAGENLLKRLKSNLIIIVGVILITYSISYLVKRSFGIEI